jgi:hypothetical protein
MPIATSLQSRGTLNHTRLKNLSSDDHTHYLLIDGTRAMTGNLNLNSNKITLLGDPTLLTDAANKSYVDSKIQGLEWQDSVLDKDETDPSGLSPSVGDRYIVGTGAIGVWAGHDDEIAEWNGSSWDFTIPLEGYACWVEDENRLYVYNGSAWVLFGSTLDHGALQGLADDDHTQYLILTGIRPMTGDFQLGGNNVTSSGAIGIKPNSDTDDYIQFLTVSNIPRIRSVGGPFYINDDAANPVNFFSDASEGEIPWVSIHGYVTGSSSAVEALRFGLSDDNNAGGVNYAYIRALENSLVLSESPPSSFDFSAYGNGFKMIVANNDVTNDSIGILRAEGGATPLFSIISNSAISFRPNNDLNDYITFTTIGSIPRLRTPGSILYINDDAKRAVHFFGQINLAGGTTYKIEDDGDTTLKDVTLQTLNATYNSSGIIANLRTTNQDISLRIGDLSAYGYYWKYTGSGAGIENRLELWSENQEGSDIQIYSIKQDGNIFWKNVNIYLASGTLYKIENTGDATLKNLTVNSIISNHTTQQKLEFFRSDATDVNLAPYITFGRGTSNRWRIQSSHDSSGHVTDVEFVSISNAGVSLDGYGDFVFKPDEVESVRFHANKRVTFQDQVNFAGGTTYKIENDGDIFFKDVDAASLSVSGTSVINSSREIENCTKATIDNVIINATTVTSTDTMTVGAAATKSIFIDSGDYYTFRDVDASYTTRFQINSADGKITVMGGFGPIDVNFANGTTYKVTSTGDAYFDDLFLTNGKLIDAVNDFVIQSTNQHFFHTAAQGYSHIFNEDSANADLVVGVYAEYSSNRSYDGKIIIYGAEAGAFQNRLTLHMDGPTAKIQFGSGASKTLEIFNDTTKVIDINTSNHTSFYKTVSLPSTITAGNILSVTNSATLAGTLRGIDMDLSGVTPGTFDLRGISVLLPATYSSGIEYAGYFSGDGKIVKICNDTWALQVETGGNTALGGQVYITGNTYFAGGSTYKVSNVGDAVFRNIAADSIIRVDTTTDESVVLNATDNGWAYIGFKHSNARKAFIGIDNVEDLRVTAETANLKLSCAGSFDFTANDLNFAGGTTYKVSSTGVATLNIAADDATYTGIVTSDSGVLKYRTKAEIASDIQGSIDHGSITGLGDDDHTQYLLADCSRTLGGVLTPDGNGTRDLGTSGARFKDFYLSGNLSDATNTLTVANAKTAYDHSQIVTGNPHSLDIDDLGNVNITSVQDGDMLQYDSTPGEWKNIPSVTDHGGLTGLTDDDHSQYFMVTGRTNENLGFNGTGKITSNDSDTLWQLGRAALGYNATDTDEACFAHRDNMSNVNYALKQDAAGATIVNAKTGQSVKQAVNDTEVTDVNASGLQLGGGGARVNDIDTAMATDPADDELLTAEAISEYADVAHCHIFYPYGNTALSVNYGASYDMGSGSDDNQLAGTIQLPANWRKTSATLYVLYNMGSTTGDYSVEWSISQFKSGETASSWNILNASTIHDFTNPATVNKLATHSSISLTSLEPGDKIGFLIDADASNTPNLNIYAVWIE